jgi:hypothetical protein
MKVIILIFGVSFLFGCRKEAIKNCTEYHKIIGNWISIDSSNDEFNELEFSKNGFFGVKSGTHRASRERITFCQFTNIVLDYQPNFIAKGNFHLETKHLTSDVLINETFDTILYWDGPSDAIFDNIGFRKRFVKK